MYTVYADDICIYTDAYVDEKTTLYETKLTLEDNSAGQFDFSMPTTNVGYDILQRVTSRITIYRESEEIWSGRIISESKDFWNNRIFTCEGELAFLNDSIQPQGEYHDISVRTFLETLIATHNSLVTEDYQFTVGAVTVTDEDDSIFRYTNYESTLECISDKLVDRLGGHIRVRKEDGVRYLDYLADYPNTNSQIIEFGKNLLDFTRNWDSTDFCTVIVPLGNRLDSSPIEALDAYLTVESVNDGSIYVESDAVETYGKITKVVKWEDVSIADNLLKKAKEYLSDVQFDTLELSLSAVDLNYLNADYEEIKLLDKVRVISYPHGLDKYFPVTKLELDLTNPEAAQFTLGESGSTSMSSGSNSVLSNISSELKTQTNTFLATAKANANSIIKMATNGYVTITTGDNGTNAIYISDTQDYTQATKLWCWNMNGLGYSSTGYEGEYGLAITMDGSIVADYITTGTLNADLIKAGKLQDSDGSTVFDLEAGSLVTTRGTIGGVTIQSSGLYMRGGDNAIRWRLDSNGYWCQNVGIYSNPGSVVFFKTVDDEQIRIGDLRTTGSSSDDFGLSLRIEDATNWFRLSAKEDNTYYTKVMYVSKEALTEDYELGTLNVFCDIYAHNYKAYQFWIDPETGGCNGGYSGSVKMNNVTMTFKHGMLVSVDS